MSNIFITLPHMKNGGIQIAFLKTLHFFDEMGYEITVGLEKKEGELLDQIPKKYQVLELLLCDHSCLHSIKMIPYILKIKRIIWYILLLLSSLYNKAFNDNYYYMRCLSRVVLNLPKSKYDVVVSYGHPTAFTIFYTTLVKHNYSKMWIHGDAKTQAFNDNIVKAYNKYDEIVCVSNTSKELLLSRFPNIKPKISVCYYRIDTNELIRKSKEYRVPKKAGIRMLTVARLAPEKGIDLILETAYLLKQKHIPYTWVICGNGDAKYIEQSDKMMLNNDLLFVGYVDNPYPYYLWANIYIQTSFSEGYCIALKEATFFNNLYVISTNIPVAKEHINNQEKGTIVDFSAKALSMAIMKRIKDE